eukprot:832937_1
MLTKCIHRTQSIHIYVVSDACIMCTKPIYIQNWRQSTFATIGPISTRINAHARTQGDARTIQKRSRVSILWPLKSQWKRARVSTLFPLKSQWNEWIDQTSNLINVYLLSVSFLSMNL